MSKFINKPKIGFSTEIDERIVSLEAENAKLKEKLLKLETEKTQLQKRNAELEKFVLELQSDKPANPFQFDKMGPLYKQR